MKRVALVSLTTPSLALADTEGYEHMMDWGYGYGFGMVFGPVLWLIVLGLIVASVIWLVRRLDGGQNQNESSKALAELNMRFARGELDAEEYTTRKRLLSD